MGVEVDRADHQREIAGSSISPTRWASAGKIRLLKNIMGLWLVQECRRAWACEGREYSYEQLTRHGGRSAAIQRRDRSRRVPRARRHAGEDRGALPRDRGSAPPATHGEFARTILESLALRYRQVLESLEALAGRKIEVIHIVGGGSRNELLNQFVADCTGRTVIAGPSEATAIGNILVQAMGAGELANLDAARSVVRNSFELTTVDPHPSAEWERAYQRYF